MLTLEEQTRFYNEQHSIRTQYNNGAITRENAKEKFANLYAITFGCFTAIYEEMILTDFEECFRD